MSIVDWNWAGIRVLTFDCYGTLIDWESGILRVLEPWAATNGVLTRGDELLAAFGMAESSAQAANPKLPYRAILRQAMAGIAKSFGKTVRRNDEEALAASVGDWPAFRDTAVSLQALQTWQKLMVVSNVDEQSFQRTASKLGVVLDGLVTAEEVGAYKPDRRMFEKAMARAAGWGVKKGEIVHVAQSLYHDVEPAKELGLRTVWVDRRGGKSGGATPVAGKNAKPDLRVGSLAELVEIQRAARSA